MYIYIHIYVYIYMHKYIYIYRVGKEEIPSLESELILAEESLNEISVEIEYARKQEIELTQATGIVMI
jgi:hypothetical protein